MEIAALVIAIIALVNSIRATSKGSGPNPEDLERDARRRVENLREEFERELATLRRLLAAVAEGQTLDAQQIEEGRLWRDLDPNEGRALVEAGEVDLLDVRTPQETAGGIIPGAQIIPIDQLEERAGEIRRSGKPLLVYCAGGGRSAAACQFLSEQGQSGLANLSGGISAWSGQVVRPTE